MSRIIVKGAIDQSIYFTVIDSTSTTGARRTAIAHNAAGLTAYYVRNRGVATVISLASLAAADSAHSDGGWREIDATNAPGLYRLDLPDAAVASGADSVVVTVKGAANMVQVDVEIQLVALDIQAATIPANVTQYGGVAGTFSGGRPEVNASHAGGTAWGSGAITAASLATGAITAAKFAAGAVDAAALATDAVAEIADGVWDEPLAGHLGAGSTGAALNAAGAAGDPWSTILPGAYGAGTAGNIIGNRIDVAISSRSTYAGADTSGTTTLLSRLTATRAGHLDNLSGGAVALASTILDAAGIRAALGLSAPNLDSQLDALPTATENADALLGRNIAGGSSSGRIVSQALAFLRNRWVSASGTLTVYATDDTSVLWTASLTQTAGDPVSAVDPA